MANPTITRGAFAKHLVPGLHAIAGAGYKEVDNEHLPLFEIVKSKRSFEEEVMVSGLSVAQEVGEGADTPFDSSQEIWSSRYTMLLYKLGMAITQEAIEDDQYGTVARKKASDLGRAFARTKQIKAANVFNNGFSSNFLGGDGKPLFATDHPLLDGAAQSNRDSVALSEGALEQMFIRLHGYRDDRGQLISVTPQSLHIAPGNIFVASKILNSTLTTIPMVAGSNNVSNANDVNAVKLMGLFPKGHHVNRRFTNSNAWFVRTDCPNGTKLFERIPLTFSDDSDKSTSIIKFFGRTRYAFGWTDWRQWYGSTT